MDLKSSDVTPVSECTVISHWRSKRIREGIAIQQALAQRIGLHEEGLSRHPLLGNNSLMLTEVRSQTSTWGQRFVVIIAIMDRHDGLLIRDSEDP